MSKSHPIPTEINLHKQSGVLDVSFDTGETFSLSAEYLRTHSPSAEVQGHGPGQEVLQIGKENVLIETIQPVGNYAILIHFNDGHNTGIFAWDTLYRLGSEFDTLWPAYLARLEAAGHKRKKPTA